METTEFGPLPKKLPRDLIPIEYQETGLLPICPCGCESQLPDDYRLRDVDPPGYVKKAYRKSRKTWLETERSIIHDGRWEEDPLVHRMRHMKCLMPWVCHDPCLVRLMARGLQLQQDGVKIHSFMGHASSGKTNYIVVRGYQSIDIWPEHSEVFVASPTKVGAVYLLWSQFEAMHDQLKKKKNYDIYKRGTVISINNKLAGPGTISLVGIDKVGSLRGKKMRDQNKGELIMAADEVGEFPNTAFLRIIANAKSQRGLTVLTGTNFRDLHGLDGMFHEPSEMAWEDIDQEMDYEWATTLNGWSSRLRAKRSPNIVIGFDYYPYLLTENGHNELLAYGENSPDYMSQGDAFPSVESISRTLITTMDFQSSGSYEDVRLTGDKEKFVFLDPSFTSGGDAAAICQCEFGQTIDGDDKIRAVEMSKLAVHENRRWDEGLIESARSFRMGKPLKEGTAFGEKIDPFDLCAILLGEYCRDHGVPFENVEYDESLRGKLVHAVNFYLGPAPTPVSYIGKADTHPVFPTKFRWVKIKGQHAQQVPMLNNELYGKMVSQFWFIAANVIKAGYLRNGFVFQSAFDEMKKRLQSRTGPAKKLDIESKIEYKSRNNNKSPDSADALCGCLNQIVRKRMSPKLDESESSQGATAMTIDLFGDLAGEPAVDVKMLSR